VSAIEDRATIGALVYYLRRRDLATFDVRKKPNTMAYLNQRLKSLDGFDRFWYEVLQTGHLNGTGQEVFNSDDEWFVARFVPSAVLVDRYKEFNRSAQKYQTVQTSEVTASVQRLCPSASTDRQIYKAPGLASAGQRRGLKLPDLATARADFERVIGGKVPWE
jgi:hypothetical protein